MTTRRRACKGGVSLLLPAGAPLVGRHAGALLQRAPTQRRGPRRRRAGPAAAADGRLSWSSWKEAVITPRSGGRRSAGTAHENEEPVNLLLTTWLPTTVVPQEKARRQ